MELLTKGYNVLVACEESQEVCKAFRSIGFNAFSCDIQAPSGGHPEWHICGDVLPYLNGYCTFETLGGNMYTIAQAWDLLIAHPPCTYLSNAGARHLFPGGKLNVERYKKGVEATNFFLHFWNANCEHIAVENPTASKIYGLPPYNQVIQPWMFGHPYQKRTCLWLKNLPCLIPTQIMEKRESTAEAVWFNAGSSTDRQKRRSKTFPGIAKAMAEQWGKLLTGERTAIEMFGEKLTIQ